ncbi:MAG: hypothetical protein WCW78_03925 [Candidatus Paceibacterota bacterium]|jgi:hypothetical protein
MEAMMSCAILVHAPTMNIIVGPFSDEAAADEWINKKRKNPDGYLGVINGINFSFEVLPFQSADMIPTKDAAQVELPFSPSPIK